MRTFSIVAVCVTNCLIGLRYVYLIRKDRISPALAMWVFFTVAVVGSLATYLAEGNYGLLDNALNSADLLLCGGVAIAIALWGNRSSRFSRFDFGCLGGVVVILVAWLLTQQHVIAHSGIQLILIIAYLPVIKRLWESDSNTESFTMWIGLLLAPVFSLLSSKGTLAAIYAIRAIACTSMLLLLMIRVDLRARRRRTE